MRWTTSCFLLLTSLIATGATRAATESDAFDPVSRLLQAKCAMPGCHAGPKPAQGMGLESEQIYRSTVNVKARTDSRFLRVSPGDPEHSLVYIQNDIGHLLLLRARGTGAGLLVVAVRGH